MLRTLTAVVTILLVAGPLRAGSEAGISAAATGGPTEVCQNAVLRNGFSLRYARREALGGTVRLWVCSDAGAGYVEIPTEQIERFEQAETLAAVPAGASERPLSGMPGGEDPIRKLITYAAERHHLDADFVASVVKAESAFNPGAVSSKGARGLMQIMPSTAAALGVVNVLDPAQNVEAGTKYLHELLDQYAGDTAKALAAYNAGPQRVEHYGGIPPFRETRAYVAQVINDYNRRKKIELQTALRPTDK